MPLEHLVVADSPTSLADGLALVDALDVVGVDVERADWNRYWRVPALIQVGGQGRVAVFDPLTLDDLSSLDELLRSRPCVLHAVENDSEPLAAAGITLHHVEDTAVAAAMLGLPTGLEALLADLLDVTLASDKQAMQRADWEARPLPADMISYAAGDVADLPALWATLAERLDAAGRRAWYEESLAAVLAQPTVAERRAWTRTKGAGRLDPVARGRLRTLWETRERLARDTDTAPGRIAGDAVLVDLAITPPSSQAELGRRGVRRQAARRFGAELVAAVAGSAPDESPRRHGRAPTESDRANAERLRQLRATRAVELGIDPGVLCPSRTLLSAVMTDPPDCEGLRRALGLLGWQWERLGPAFCEALEIGPAGRADAGAPTGAHTPQEATNG